MHINRQAFQSAQQKVINSFSQSANKKEDGYIIMPPSENSIFKSEGVETPTLDSFGVSQHEELDIVGGYLANLSNDQVEAMKQKGFKVFKDEVHNYLPSQTMPNLNTVAEGAFNLAKEKIGKDLPEASDGAQSTSLYQPRNEMTEPRFNSTVENAFRGRGVTVAVLDTGVNAHPDLGDRLLGQIDFVNGEVSPYDDNGHGMHVAGTIAGDGTLNELYAGPASEAKIISMKVLAGNGGGRTSDIVKAIQTAVELKDDLNIDVINMSLGGPASKNGEEDPINQAIKAAKEAGITVVVAAGNDGPGRMTVGSPGNSLNAITVGALDDNNTPYDRSDDKPASFSSRGPTPDGVTKPDVMAPGVGIMAAKSPRSESAMMAEQMNQMHQSILFLDKLPFEHLKNAPNELFNSVGISDSVADKIKMHEKISDLVFEQLLKATARMPLDETGGYIGMSGTSMATPVVAGVVAQMLQANPDLTPDQVKDILMETAVKLPDGRLGPNTQGAGAVDGKAAILKALSTEGERPLMESAQAEDPLAAMLSELGLSLEDLLIGGGEEGEGVEDAPESDSPDTDQEPAEKTAR